MMYSFFKATVYCNVHGISGQWNDWSCYWAPAFDKENGFVLNVKLYSVILESGGKKNKKT